MTKHVASIVLYLLIGAFGVVHGADEVSSEAEETWPELDYTYAAEQDEKNDL